MTDPIQAAIAKLREAREKATEGPWIQWVVTTAPQECPDGKMRPLIHGCAPPHGIPTKQGVKTADIIEAAALDGAFIALSANTWDAMCSVISATADYQRERAEIAAASSEWQKTPAEIRMDEALSALSNRLEQKT